jgi:hypothetical protein
MSGYIGTQPVPQATQTRDSFTATSGQTSFATGGYTPNFLDVYLNGVKLASADYTASNGSDVVLASGAATGDILEVVAFTTFNSASSSIDDNGNATALTITSDEQVLIGKTSTGLSVTGTQITSDGRLMVTRDGNQAADFNRKSSDGDIVKFQKDGTTVGSIGTQGGDLVLGTGDTGIKTVDTLATIVPYNTTTNSSRDASIDLGYPTNRFKNLYLSGGVYLGGTGSANKLDDYEEGTWTPTLGGNAVHDIQTGHYVKVGGLVYAFVAIRPTSLGTGSTNRISGLPFPTSDLVGISVSYYDGAATNHYSIAGGVTSNYIDIYLKTSATNDAYNSTNFFQNNARIYAQVTYRTTA